MKAAVLVKNGNAHEAFEIKDWPKPSRERGQVLLKVSHFGLNFADVMARNGLYAAAPPIPCVLGYECVGIVEEADEDAPVKPGDKVLAFTRFGSYAQYAVADTRTVVKLSEQVDEAQATALATQYCTAWYAARMVGSLRKRETVLIHAAAGGVGTALIQIAKELDCRVIATAGSDEKMQYLNLQGADVTINYNAADYVAEIKRLVGEESVDVTFNPIGGKTVKKDIEVLAKGGRAILFGSSTWSDSDGGMIAKLKLAWDFGLISPIKLMMKSQALIGLNMLAIAQKSPEIIGECLDEVVSRTQKGVFKPHVGAEYPVSRLSEAHNFLASRRSLGKVVVSWLD